MNGIIFYLSCGLDVIWMLIMDAAFRKGNWADKIDVIVSSMLIIPLLTALTYYAKML